MKQRTHFVKNEKSVILQFCLANPFTTMLILIILVAAVLWWQPREDNDVDIWREPEVEKKKRKNTPAPIFHTEDVRKPKKT